MLKRIGNLVGLVGAVAATTISADVQLKPSSGHFATGLGAVVSDLPVASADFKVPVGTVYYERHFMNPTSPIHTSAELGLFCFYGLLPFPELSANLYIGGEDRDVQGKIGLGGFYDLAVGGHAGLMGKIGTVFKNRFDVSLFFVPIGNDATQSYGEFFGFESPDEASEAYANNNNQHVVMPYYGFMFTVRY